MRLLLSGLTEFGDTAVLMPLAAAMLLWLLAMRSPRDAAWWAIAVALCVGTTVLLKVWFYGCPAAADLHNPSGHTSLSTLVYGAVALVTASQIQGMQRIIAVGGAAGFILVIAVSRLLLHKHSTAEIAVGLVIGIAALTSIRLAIPAKPSKGDAVVPAAYGRRHPVMGTPWPRTSG